MRLTNITFFLAILLLTWFKSATAYSASAMETTPKEGFFHTSTNKLSDELCRTKKDTEFDLMLFFSTSTALFANV